MIKADIVKKVAEQLKVKDKEALVIVDSILEAMKKIVAENGRLEIRDFGVFQTKQRKQRLGRNPKDKKEYPIPPRQVVTFKMGKELKLSGSGTHGNGASSGLPDSSEDFSAGGNSSGSSNPQF
jgi:nucleoid DNA-binding protein